MSPTVTYYYSAKCLYKETILTVGPQ